jgi:hypothetical protein
MVARKLVAAGLPALLAMSLALAASASSGHAAASTCSTRGLHVGAGTSAFRVTRLRARGIACTKARSIARTVAADLLHNRAVSISGSDGFSLDQESCTGCAPTTQVAIAYPRGTITISLRGTSQPAPPPVTGGSGSPTVV